MNHHIIVIGSSAGGLEALKKLLSYLPADFKPPIFLVRHVSPDEIDQLCSILKRHCLLPVVAPRHGEEIKLGTVYIAPPNFHTTLEDGKISIQHGPRVNHCRPAIDPLFFSAAATYGTRAIGIILSGLLDDGSAGLHAIKRNGGVAIVQDLKEAQYADMPRNALESVPSAHCLKTKEIAKLLIKLVKKPITKKDCITSESKFILNCETKMNNTIYSNSTPFAFIN